MQGSTPALLWPRGANQGAQPVCQDRSHNEVMEGQTNSFRDQPLAAGSRNVSRGTLRGPNFTTWFWCLGDAVGWGGRGAQRQGPGAVSLCHPPLLESWDPRCWAEHSVLLAPLYGVMTAVGMGPSQTLSTTHHGVVGEK